MNSEITSIVGQTTKSSGGRSELGGRTPPLTIVQVPIGDLRPDPFNPRRISDEELSALTRSLQQFGFVDPLIARREDMSVIGGHQRLVAARRLGFETVPVVFLDITLEKRTPPQPRPEQDFRLMGRGTVGATPG